MTTENSNIKTKASVESSESQSQSTAVVESREVRSVDGSNDRKSVMRGRLESNTEDSEDVEMDVCPECATDIADIGNEEFCPECGYIQDDSPIDHGPEWRAFNHTEREEKSRTGAPETVMQHDKGLATSISWQDRDGFGKSLSSSQRQKAKRLRKWNKRMRTNGSSERNLIGAINEINRMASALNIPEDVREVAVTLYKTISNSTDSDDKPMLPGRSIEGVASACLHIACRQCKIARTLDDINSVSKIEPERISRTRRYISKEQNIPVPPAQPKQYLPSICSDLNIPSEAERYARDILEELQRTGSQSGKNPKGLAATAVYLAARQMVAVDSVTQKEVGECADVTAVTIRNHMKTVKPFATPDSDYITGNFETDMGYTQSTTTTETDEAEDNSPSNNSEGNGDNTVATFDDCDIDTTWESSYTEVGIDTSEKKFYILYTDDCRQWSIMAEAITFIAENETMTDKINIPYKPPKCKREFIVFDDEKDRDYSATWREVDVSDIDYLSVDTLFFNTKLAKDGKYKFTEKLLNIFGYSVEIVGDW